MNSLLVLAKPRCQRDDRYFSVPHQVGPTDATLEFGRYRVLLRQRRLLAGGVPVALGARAFDILIVLIEADGALVTKDELQRRVWPGVVVAPENLKVQIFALRKALGDDRELVRTEHGRGYRFAAEVSRLGSERNERRRRPHNHAGHSGLRARRRRPSRSISDGSDFSSETLLDPVC